MRYPTLILTLLFVFSLTSLSSAALQNPQDTPTKPLYQPTGNEATVTGQISVNGEVPRQMRYDMTADPICEKLNEDKNPVQDLMVNQQRVQNTFVYIKSGEPLDTYRFEMPSSEVVLEHKNCRFVPLVLGIRVGQKLSVVNSDPVVHNTHPMPKYNQEWNASQAAGGPPIVNSFSHAEQFFLVKDNMHPWKRAVFGVFDHPFFAVSDQSGGYEIRGLPPGKYKLVAWHERLGRREMDITIVGGESRQVDFTFDLPRSQE
jgi:hypothetical protein